MMHITVRSYPQAGRRMLFVLPPVYEHEEAVRPSHHPIMTATLVAQAIRGNGDVGVLDASLLGCSQKDILDIIVYVVNCFGT